MQKMYSKKRQTTLNKIQDAINAIQDDNRIVTKRELLELTKISSGTFSQEYVKELLKENQVCQFRNVKVVASEKREKLQQKNYDDLAVENQKLVSKMQDFEIVMERNYKKYTKLKNDYDKLESEHKLLKGKYQQLLEYLDALGANLDSLPLI